MQSLRAIHDNWLEPTETLHDPDLFQCGECGELKAELVRCYCTMCARKICNACAIETKEGDTVCSVACRELYKILPVKEV